AFNTPIFQEELIELNIKLKIEDLTQEIKKLTNNLKTKNLLILKYKNNSAYKLGKSLIKAHKAWYKGGYIKFIFSLISFCFNKNINKLK
ncbi:hypothetical protein CINS5438_07565, partial [Campylobacter insulaenigrae]|nr:hypothetical protein [Campylobacter insulaenigrae]